jgi:hypothetical protein
MSDPLPANRRMSRRGLFGADNAINLQRFASCELPQKIM